MASTIHMILLWILTCMQLSLPGPLSVMPDDRDITFLYNGIVKQQTCTLSKPRRLLSDIMYHHTTLRELELGDVREYHIEQKKKIIK
jgi:hypothetical protein